MAELPPELEIEVESEAESRVSARQVWVWALRLLREIAETLIPAVVIAVAINIFLAQATQVLGQSMEPTLHNTDRVVVEKVSYSLLHGPQRGDVVVIDLPSDGELLIKRVIGLEAETVEVRGGEVYINGELLVEEWTVRLGGGSYGPVTVPPLHVFVLGDNRGASNDSRAFGPVAIECLVGRAWLSYWPLEHFGFVE